MWTLDIHNDVEKRRKKIEKKWSHELRNVLDNLDTLLKSVAHGVRSEQLKQLGFVHSEPQGVLAIDQKGPGKGTKMKQLRLYVVVDEEDEIVYARVLGDKSSQETDLKVAVSFAEAINEKKTKGATDGEDTQDNEGGEG